MLSARVPVTTFAGGRRGEKGETFYEAQHEGSG